jgi:Gpi18-like mannosyltransferase
MNQIMAKYRNLILILGVIILALYVRRGVITLESIDFKLYLNPWYDYILQNGRFAALKDTFSNYNPAYLYLLVLASYLLPNLSNIMAIKSISIIFDFLGAFLVYKIVHRKYPKGQKPLLALIAVLFAPTVFTNSAYWGQCDMIYTSFLLAFVYFAALQKDTLAFVSFGLAFAFKFQALFLGPVVLILMVKRYLDWKKVFWIPAVYLILLLPSVIAGRSIKDLLLIYLAQSGAYPYLTRNAPNIYQWFPNNSASPRLLLILVAAIAITIIVLTVLLAKMPFSIDRDLLIQFSLASALIMPYLLPKMHDRYFFPADIFSIIYGFYFPRFGLIPVIIIFSSFLSYLSFLTAKNFIAMRALALILAITVIIVTGKLFQDINDKNQIQIQSKISDNISYDT